jgi:DNA-binding NtrC family response regulator
MAVNPTKLKYSTDSGANQSQVLLIENDDAIFRLLSGFIQQNGYQVQTVKSLQDAHDFLMQLSDMPPVRAPAPINNDMAAASGGDIALTATTHDPFTQFKADIAQVIDRLWPHLAQNDGLQAALAPLFEAALIQKAMQHADYSQIQAAKNLGMNRNTLRSKLKKHQLYGAL